MKKAVEESNLIMMDSEQESEKLERIRSLLCGDFVSSYPIEILEYLGYDIWELYCDVCGKSIAPRIFKHNDVECIKSCYVFENREQCRLFVCCKKNCKREGIRMLSQETFLDDIESVSIELRKISEVKTNG